jgi:hypothetical protein
MGKSEDSGWEKESKLGSALGQATSRRRSGGGRAWDVEFRLLAYANTLEVSNNLLGVDILFVPAGEATGMFGDIRVALKERNCFVVGICLQFQYELIQGLFRIDSGLLFCHDDGNDPLFQNQGRREQLLEGNTR